MFKDDYLTYTDYYPQPDPKKLRKAKDALDSRFAELGGNAVSRDKKGRPKADDSSMQQDLAGVGGDTGYEPYVFYEFEIV
jgi:V-type H+-transporting ATPase subunit C